MKKSAIALVVLAVLIGAITWVGLTHGSSSNTPKPEVGEKLLLAEKFLERGQSSKALETIAELTDNGYKLGEKGDILALRAYSQAGDHKKAAEAASTFLTKYPESTERTEAELVRLTSELATSGLSNPVLRQSVEDFLTKNPAHPGAPRLQIALAEQEVSLGDYAAAQRRLETIMAATKDDELILRIAEPLGRVNLDKLFSSTLAATDTTYTVERGDTINGIARKNGITEELLMKCNGIDDPRKLRVGQRLKVPSIDFSLHVDIASNTMILKNFGEFFKLYPVRTGREATTTPNGEFKILNKKRNPTWKPGNGYTYMPGDPNNELGTRWMAFEGDILGIHGTVHPDTVGEYASNGCIGLTREDVEELFDLVSVGTPLAITGQQDLERHKVLPAPQIPPPQQVAQN